MEADRAARMVPSTRSRSRDDDGSDIHGSVVRGGNGFGSGGGIGQGSKEEQRQDSRSVGP